MPEDVRRSAEIRRMASQKVAAELIKCSTFAVSEPIDTGFSHFLDLVDLIDKDVVEAGDRAEDRRAPTPGPTPRNGSEAASEPATTLSAAARSKLVQLLEEIDAVKVEAKLRKMNLPIFPEDAAKDMTMDQARDIAKWSRELANA